MKSLKDWIHSRNWTTFVLGSDLDDSYRENGTELFAILSELIDQPRLSTIFTIHRVKLASEILLFANANRRVNFFNRLNFYSLQFHRELKSVLMENSTSRRKIVRKQRFDANFRIGNIFLRETK